jgi:DNA-directed RNA polymerase subunit M/transcription elongation factor TFIIS
MTSALRGRLRKGNIQYKCRKCNTWYEITTKDASTPTEIKSKKKMEYKDRYARIENEADALGLSAVTYRQRLYFGLCLRCGEPAKNSARYCEKCKGKEAQE